MIKATAVGRVTRDFETRRDSKNRPWGVFCIASSRRYVKSGAAAPETDYVNVYVSGGIVEHCVKYLKKGMVAAASGDMELHRSTGKDGREYASFDLRNADIQWFSAPEK